VPRLRVAYPADYLTTGIAYAPHPHRDTWYWAPRCQLSWWMPNVDIDADQRMAVPSVLLGRIHQEQFGGFQLLPPDCRWPEGCRAARRRLFFLFFSFLSYQDACVGCARGRHLPQEGTADSYFNRIDSDEAGRRRVNGGKLTVA